jgi:hypothetical protein
MYIQYWYQQLRTSILKLLYFGQPCGHLQGCKIQRLDTCRILLCHHHHHHHIFVMELGYLLTRSGLTYPEVFLKVCHNSFCQLGEFIVYIK